MKGFVFFLLILLVAFQHPAYAQPSDSIITKNETPVQRSHFSGSFAVTNNGISLVPTFSLGKPAGVVMLAMGRGKWSFEPEFRFSLSGKPWSAIFWARYQAVKSNLFSLRFGAHPAINFRTQNVGINGEIQDAIVARRFLAFEAAPNYFIKKNLSIGSYYLYAYGVDKNTPRNGHFITLNANFSRIPITQQYFFKFAPQIFYLKQDNKDGCFATATVTLARDKFPLSASALFNKELKKGIIGAQDFVWSASLIYSFGRQYIAQ